MEGGKKTMDPNIVAIITFINSIFSLSGNTKKMCIKLYPAMANFLQFDNNQSSPTIRRLPSHHISREKDLKALKNNILANFKQDNILRTFKYKYIITKKHTISNDAPTCQIILIYGSPGIGKSVMAAELARDNNIKRAFTDGIFWIDFADDSSETDILYNQSWLIRELCNEVRNKNHPPASISNIQEGKKSLEILLANRKCLLILNDIRKKDQIYAFDSIGPNSMMLITSRDSSLDKPSGAVGYELKALSIEESRRLMAKYSGFREEGLPICADEIAQECGYNPLALASICSTIKGKKHMWGHMLEKVKRGDFESLKLTQYKYSNLFSAIEISIEELNKNKKKKLSDLAIFPKGVRIPQNVLAHLWNLDLFSINELLIEFEEKSLIERDEGGNIIISNLISKFLANKSGNQNQVHKRFLKSYKKKCENNSWISGPDDGYYFQHLAYHMSFTEGLSELLLDLKWMEAKLNHTDYPSLISDYRIGKEDPQIGPIYEALELSSNTLSRDKRQLPTQLYGRLMGYDEIKSKLFKSAVISHPWVRLIYASLITPSENSQIICKYDTHITAMEIIDDNKVILATNTGEIEIYNLKDGTKNRLKGHESSISSIASLNRNRLVSSSGDKDLVLWDLDNGKIIRTFKGHNDWVNTIAVRCDGIAVTGSKDNTIKLWNLFQENKSRTIGEFDVCPTAIDFMPEGDRIVCGFYDGTIRIIDMSGYDKPIFLSGHKGAIKSLIVSNNGRTLITGSEDKTIMIWDLQELNEPVILNGHADVVSCLAIDATGRLITGSYDRKIRIWYNNKCILTLPRDISAHTGWITSLVLFSDNKRILTGSFDGTIRMWYLDRSDQKRSYPHHEECVRTLVVTSDGKWLISGSDDGSIKIWDLEIAQRKPMEPIEPIQKRSGLNAIIRVIAVTPDNKYVLSESEDHKIEIWNIEHNKQEGILIGHKGSISSIAINAKMVVSGSYDKTLRIWDLANFKERLCLKSEWHWITAVILSHDGECIIAGSENGKVILWKTQELSFGASLKPEMILETHRDRVSSLAITSDNNQIVSGSKDGTIKICNLSTRETKELGRHKKGVNAVSLSQDNQKLISVSEDGVLKVWDLQKNKTLALFNGESPIRSCVFSQDGVTIMAGEKSGRIHIMKLDTPQNSEY